MTEREFQTIIDKLNILEQNNKMLAYRLNFYSEKLDLYKQVSDEKLEAWKKNIRREN